MCLRGGSLRPSKNDSLPIFCNFKVISRRSRVLIEPRSGERFFRAYGAQSSYPSYHGLRPWLGSAAAPRLLSDALRATFILDSSASKEGHKSAEGEGAKESVAATRLDKDAAAPRHSHQGVALCVTS